MNIFNINYIIFTVFCSFQMENVDLQTFEISRKSSFCLLFCPNNTSQKTNQIFYFSIGKSSFLLSYNSMNGHLDVGPFFRRCMRQAPIIHVRGIEASIGQAFVERGGFRNNFQFAGMRDQCPILKFFLLGDSKQPHPFPSA